MASYLLMHCVAAGCTACRQQLHGDARQWHRKLQSQRFQRLCCAQGHAVQSKGLYADQIHHPRQQLRHNPSTGNQSSAVRQVQGGEYGKTRLWGAVGWGGFSPLGGVLVDRLGERAAFWGNLVGCALGFLPTLLSPVQV